MTGMIEQRPRLMWRVGDRVMALGERTLIMGILNCTPDSFSDGGRHGSVEAAVAHGLAMLDENADLLDLGAESTRPGATPVTPEVEQGRLLPVLRGLRRARPEVLLAVDTYHAGTAAEAMAAGAAVVNDVSGLLWDGEMARTLAGAEPRPGVVLMHARGTPASWASLPALAAGEETTLVMRGLAEQLAAAVDAGVDRESVVLDPGFGFGKRGDENMALLARLGGLKKLGRPVLVGLSRKGFLASGGVGRGGTENISAASARSEERLYATIAANVAAVLGGAHVLRVHDVAAGREAAMMGDRLLAAGDARDLGDAGGGTLARIRDFSVGERGFPEQETLRSSR